MLRPRAELKLFVPLLFSATTPFSILNIEQGGPTSHLGVGVGPADPNPAAAPQGVGLGGVGWGGEGCPDPTLGLYPARGRAGQSFLLWGQILETPSTSPWCSSETIQTRRPHRETSTIKPSQRGTQPLSPAPVLMLFL